MNARDKRINMPNLEIHKISRTKLASFQGVRVIVESDKMIDDYE